MACLKGTRTLALCELLSDFLASVTEVQGHGNGMKEAGDPGNIYEMQPCPASLKATAMPRGLCG